MVSMAKLKEYRIVSSAGRTGELLDNVPNQIATHVSSTQSLAGNKSSLSSELAAIAMMTYSELHVAWRRQYRAIPPKKISRDILEVGIAWRIQENKLGGLGTAVKRRIAELA